MITIYKYPIAIDDEQDVAMPASSQLLSVQEQLGTPCMWALVDPSVPMTRRRIATVGTGHPAQRVASGACVGTYQHMDGQLIFHVFDLGETS
jgi:hypothetical protein